MNRLSCDSCRSADEHVFSFPVAAVTNDIYMRIVLCFIICTER